MSKLKPCPFCGGKADIDGEWVFCKDCGVGYEKVTIKKSISAWNKRIGEKMGQIKGSKINKEGSSY